jgi:hypothetical protein
LNLDSQVMETYLRRAIDEFDRSPLAPRLMRRLCYECPELFTDAAIKHLLSGPTSNAHRLLAILLMRQEKLFDLLSSPDGTSRDNSVKLFRRLLEVDPSFDVKLARKLPGRSYWNPAETFDSARSARALDILDETSHGRRLLPILGHLTDSPDAAVSAKATLFVGRRVQNPNWTRKQLQRPDQRVRANAVEALWGVNTPSAVGLFEDCAADRNNRVVGNSLIGLHIVGREDAGEEVLAMSRNSTPDVRSTAAWAMGKIVTPAFAPRLRELIVDENPHVRSMALKSLREVHKALEAPATPHETPHETPHVTAAPVEQFVRVKPVIEYRIPSWAGV